LDLCLSTATLRASCRVRRRDHRRVSRQPSWLSSESAWKTSKLSK
jgi:hypothetical protein